MQHSTSKYKYGSFYLHSFIITATLNQIFSFCWLYARYLREMIMTIGSISFYSEKFSIFLNCMGIAPEGKDIDKQAL
jgi:hypothetical protein